MGMTLKTLLIGKSLRRTCIRAGLVGLVVAVVCITMYRPMIVEGESMSPTYHTGQLNVINQTAYWFSGPGRGDVVAIRLAGPSIAYLKRIIALPGETVEIRDGVTRVNGDVLEEPYVVNRVPWTYEETVLEADQFLVIGDNRGMPIDNHMMGKARRKKIMGKIGW